MTTKLSISSKRICVLVKKKKYSLLQIYIVQKGLTEHTFHEVSQGVMLHVNPEKLQVPTKVSSGAVLEFQS